MASELFPPEIKSTMNGAAAAMGKVGAIIGASMFEVIYDKLGVW